jgi:hypothetical protein
VVRAVCLVCLLAVLPGCGETIYASLQTVQRNSCLSEQESAQRERCLAAADTSYGDYQRQR